jgi:hypothetical protein
MALPPYQIHENLLGGSKVIVGTHRQSDRQTGDSISLLPLLESNIKTFLTVLMYKSKLA